MAQVDKEVAELNARAPNGVTPLRKVELVARGLTEFHPSDIRVTEKCVLPPLIYSHNSGVVVNQWPPQQPSIGVQYSEMIAAAIRAAPPPPTDAEKIAASERHVAAGQADERERERLRAAG